MGEKILSKEEIKETLESGSTILTDDEIDTISNELENAASETTKNLREIMAEGENDNGDYPYNVVGVLGEPKKVLAMVEIDPYSGEKKLSPDQSMIFKEPAVGIEDVVDGTDIVTLSEISEENMKSTLSDMNMTDEDALMLIKAIKKDDDGGTVKIDELPFAVQQMVSELRGTGGEYGMKLPTKSVIKDLLGYFKTQLKMDQEIINFQDLLEKELQLPDMVAEYSLETDELMEKKLIELGEKHKEQDPDKARELFNISAAYTDAINFKTIIDAINFKDKNTKKLSRELARFNKYIRDFNFKYENNTKFTIDSLNNVLKVLKRNTGYDEDTCKMFLILFCRITQNMKPEDVVQHTYMYYTLKRIMCLDIIHKDSKLYESIIENLKSILSKL